MHRASNNVRSISKQTHFRLFGIPFKVDRNEKELLHWVKKVPATQEDIKTFLEKGRKERTPTQWSNLEVMMSALPDLSPAIYDLVNDKNDIKRYQPHKWSLEYIAPMEGKENSTSRFWNWKEKRNAGYIVILKGESIYSPGPPPPPPPNWPPRRVGPSGPPIVVSCPDLCILGNFWIYHQFSVFPRGQSFLEITYTDHPIICRFCLELVTHITAHPREKRHQLCK
jgi:hypothetical protein